jgi:hypothetical protein
LEGDNVSIVHIEIYWHAENIPLFYIPMFRDLNLDSINHVFAKERIQKLWDHIVDTFTLLEGMVLSLYARCRFVHFVNKSGNIRLISIVEIVHQELYVIFFIKHYN